MPGLFVGEKYGAPRVFLSVQFSLRANHSGNIALLECSQRMLGNYREGADFLLDINLTTFNSLEVPLPVSPGCSEPKNRCPYCCCPGRYLNCHSTNCEG